MARGSKSRRLTRRLFRDAPGQNRLLDISVEQEMREKRQKQVECLGMTFENDDARREYFLGKLREGLEELHEKLGGVEFTTVDDAIERMKLLRKWPMPGEERLRELAERMRHAERSKDLLQRWKDEVGFPHGEIEDILNLSDPPYYTACPNPFLGDFVRHYGKPYDPETDEYRREPFAADVSEGKNAPIYNAHSYHTKVPHKAVMRYILHYTEPGDIIFDGFAGTGMTGVACQLAGDRKAVESLGYSVSRDGMVKDADASVCSRLGARLAVLADLSPYVSFVAARYNDFGPAAYDGRALLNELNDTHAPLRTLYETRLPESGEQAQASFYVWSDVFACPNCSREQTYFEFAVDTSDYSVVSSFQCPSCGADLAKADLSPVWSVVAAPGTDAVSKQLKNVMVEVVANSTAGNVRYSPTEYDHALLARAQRSDYAWYPSAEFPHGRQTRKVRSGSGIGAVWQMFTPRALLIASSAWQRMSSVQDYDLRARLSFLLLSSLTLISRRERYRDGTGKGAQSGTLYVPSIQIEKNAFDIIERKRSAFARLRIPTVRRRCAVSCQSHARFWNIPPNSVDYVFTDPPFGKSLQYAELNFFQEAWLGVSSVLEDDCVINYVHAKDLEFYGDLMRRSFGEAFRILKPGRWMTVEFHNSQNNVWMAIQEALWQAGFTVADVRVLDKKQGSFNVVNRAGAVKQDLVISAYKPNGGLEERFKLEAGTPQGAWDFIRTHLRQLPVFVSESGQVEVIAERQNYLLFDRMVAFHVQRGVTVPLSAAEFYQGLAQRFPERDGMYFLPEQVAEYDRKRMKATKVVQVPLIVTDEASAIQWLRQQLKEKPQTFQEMSPQFMREIAGWEKREKPLELSEMLAQNFIRYDGEGDVPSQIHSYLSSNFKELRSLEKDDPKLRAKATDRYYVPDPNKAGDLEKLRERALLKEFWEYLPAGYKPPIQKGPEGQTDLPGMGKREKPIPKGKRMKVIRLEAVRAGFKHCWQNRDYRTIIAVAQRIPEDVRQEDPKLLMWYDQAITRTGGD